MNYKVMQRPMFKMGGKAASQGTGITSGLDEKVNMSDGRANYSDGPMTSKDFLRRALDNYNLRQQKMADMSDLIKLQALGQVSNVLGTQESNNPFDILQNITMSGSEIALPALSAQKKLELKALDPTTDLAFAKALKPNRTGSQKVYEMKKEDLRRINSELYDQSLALQKATEAGDKDAIAAITKNIALLQESKNLVFSTFKTDEELRSDLLLSAASTGYSLSDKEIDKIIKRIRGGNAEGGMPNRVERQMGSPMMGEQPMANPMAVERKDVAMETQGQGNDAYAMLRARLPQEIPDDVVRLIAYNKEAFADFASIKNQEDVSSFNQKYGVSMNIDVSTV
tara:strand:+ start:262 stop:1281 length:1020 start_codon:yes stop_codon:yes gene_type:complete